MNSCVHYAASRATPRQVRNSYENYPQAAFAMHRDERPDKSS